MDLPTFLETHPQWREENQTLIGEFKYDRFSSVCAAVQENLRLAAELDHHPEVTFGYNKVNITLTSHDASNTITDKDIEFAQKFTQQCG